MFKLEFFLIFNIGSLLTSSLAEKFNSKDFEISEFNNNLLSKLEFASIDEKRNIILKKITSPGQASLNVYN